MMHDWPKDATQAIALQRELAAHVRIANDFSGLNVVAGVDVSYDVKKNLTRAFVVLMRLDSLQPILSVKAIIPTTFPYIPGLLSFREIPAILEALKQLPHRPDLLMVDGHGIAHPRGLGIAAHLGVLTGLPAIGVAKSKLCGFYDEPGARKGHHAPLTHKGKQIGMVLRSKDNIRPLFISPGHKMDQETALQITLKCLTRYRLPEPTRIADKLSKMKEPPQPTMLL